MCLLEIFSLAYTSKNESINVEYSRIYSYKTELTLERFDIR